MAEPADPSTLLNQAKALTKRGELEESIELLSQALGLV